MNLRLRAIVAGPVLALSLAACAAAAQTPPEPAAPAPADSAPAPGPAAAPSEPFAFADFSWIPGNAGASDRPLTLGPLTGEFRLDDAYHYEFSAPKDGTISGSSEAFRHGEFQVTQLGLGGDLLYHNVMGRVMTQFGMYSRTTPRNDASPGRGQWQLADAYRYISEAYGGYHVDALHGINVQAGIFMSYVGLWSYYNADNWTYQPSYVSSNTPWFFNGVRVQIFPSDRLKIEPWLINGWQSYGRFNNALGTGLQLLWRPTGSFAALGNQYLGKDTFGTPDRRRFHSDNSVMVKWRDRPGRLIDRAAASLTVDFGCEWGDSALNALPASLPRFLGSAQYFLGFMAYQRVWLDHDRFGLTVGGGAITNPGRYLVLLPPVNGATALSGTPYFTENPGDPFKAWDLQLTADYMPRPYVTFRLEYNHRHASVPYFAGSGGMTPPGGNLGAPGSTVEAWVPDLVPDENRITAALLVKI